MYQARNVWKRDRRPIMAALNGAAGQLFADRHAAEELARELRLHTGRPVAVVGVSLRDAVAAAGAL